RRQGRVADSGRARYPQRRAADELGRQHNAFLPQPQGNEPESEGSAGAGVSAQGQAVGDAAGDRASEEAAGRYPQGPAAAAGEPEDRAARQGGDKEVCEGVRPAGDGDRTAAGSDQEVAGPGAQGTPGL